MYHLFCRKIVFIICVLISFQNAQAQQYRKYKNFIDKPYYFGITLGLNWAKYKIDKSEDFLYNDSINSILSYRKPGFNLYIISNLSLSRYFDLRLTPGLSFAERNLTYQVFNKEVPKKIESVNLDFPLHVRYKSEPIGDFRFYVLGGVKYSIDLSSNSQARKAKNIIKVNASDYSLEYGLGFQIFFQYFILSPELKVSQGMNNILFKNYKLGYSNALDGLHTRMLSLSFHFEG